MTASSAEPVLVAGTATSTTPSPSISASVSSHLPPSPLLPVESALLELHSSQQSLQQLLSAARSDYYDHTHPMMLEQLVPAFAQLDVYCRKMDEVKARLQRASKRVANIKQRTAALDADVANSSGGSGNSSKQTVAPPLAVAVASTTAASAPASSAASPVLSNG